MCCKLIYVLNILPPIRPKIWHCVKSTTRSHVIKKTDQDAGAFIMIQDGGYVESSAAMLSSLSGVEELFVLGHDLQDGHSVQLHRQVKRCLVLVVQNARVYFAATYALNTLK